MPLSWSFASLTPYVRGTPCRVVVLRHRYNMTFRQTLQPNMLYELLLTYSGSNRPSPTTLILDKPRSTWSFLAEHALQNRMRALSGDKNHFPHQPKHFVNCGLIKVGTKGFMLNPPCRKIITLPLICQCQVAYNHT